ncbi:hypothetical protein CROQUDRAFT_90589 [Cronartium quercuum f. sp. fusiforme G11]|uniref:Uncharacterized protein n=1 Tax=Cronartium quercuum f. sp. fusiforme G11 TaxID=708437 RepID=A0A9P6NJN9_9BASI|nr:hypothetical protein CROQUDRAFT_90589 [Cronartium quercuum f. sp. fusiforme G11]
MVLEFRSWLDWMDEGMADVNQLADFKGPMAYIMPGFEIWSTNLGICMLLLLTDRCLIAPLWDAPNPQAKSLMKNHEPNKPLISRARLTRAMLNCNNAGMTEPYWGNIDRFAGYVTLIFDLFTHFEQDTTAGKAFGANLWTVPWFFQAGYAVYVTHFMLGNLSSNRYWVCGLLMVFSWMSFNYFALPITGLLIADMAPHGHTARLRKLPLVFFDPKHLN